VDARRAARDQRADFAEFLASLSPQQWQAQTLRTRWRVRDVVAHVISYDHLDTRARLLPGRNNDLGGRAGLAETLIHRQDIRRALGQPRTIPADRLRPRCMPP
jgi:hypothetical protein